MIRNEKISKYNVKLSMKLQFDEHYLFLMSDIQNVFNLSNTYTEQQHLLQQMSYY
jgi:hypothetical protein